MTVYDRAIKAQQELLATVKTVVQNPDLQEACRKVLYHPGLLTAYGGSSHHSFPGGLPVHLNEVTNYALNMSNMHPQSDRDVLVTATIFHDFMKIRDYVGVAPNGITPSGMKKTLYRTLVRHVAGSHAEFMKAIDGKKIPEMQVMAIEHAILAHHRMLEWGSPVEPVLIEAFIVHFADELSAKFGPGRK
jgi:3'-5' exoribonuclease